MVTFHLLLGPSRQFFSRLAYEYNDFLPTRQYPIATKLPLIIYDARIKRVSWTFAHAWTADIDILLRAGIVESKVALQNSTTCCHSDHWRQLTPTPNGINWRHVYHFAIYPKMLRFGHWLVDRDCPEGPFIWGRCTKRNLEFQCNIMDFHSKIRTISQILSHHSRTRVSNQSFMWSWAIRCTSLPCKHHCSVKIFPAARAVDEVAT